MRRSLFLLFIPSFAFSAGYYVDATLGNDHNAGSLAAPWKTISKVNAHSFAPGDSIFFKRGETWREALVFPSSGSARSPIVLTAYGSGALPIITGRDTLYQGKVTGNWSQVNTTKHIWKFATAFHNPAAFGEGRMWFDGQEFGDSKDTSMITPRYRFRWNGKGAGLDSCLYVYAPSNPATYYSSMERSFAHAVGFSPAWTTVVNLGSHTYITLSYLYIGAGYPSINATGTHLLIEHCSLSAYSSGTGVYLGAGADYSIIRFNTFDRQDTVYHMFESPGWGLDQLKIVASYTETYNNVFINPNHSAYEILRTGSIVPSHNICRDNEFYCTSTDYGRAVAEEGGAYNLFTRNYVHNMKTRSQLVGYRDTVVYNIFDTVAQRTTGWDGLGSAASANAVDISAYDGYWAIETLFANNIIMNTADAGLIVSTDSTGNVIENNIIVNCGLNTWKGGQYSTAHGGERVSILITPRAAPHHQTIRNNLLWNSTGENPIVWNKYAQSATGWAGNESVTTFANHSGTSGWVISGNIQADPKFVSATDRALQGGSPCVGAGVNVGLTTDYLLHAVTNPPDIGAYQHIAP